MKKFLTFLCVALFVVGMAGSASALDFDFSGIFTHDNDVSLLDFTVGSSSTVTIFSSSWGDDNSATDGYILGAGFDPILDIWDNAGSLVSQQDDGHNVGSTLSNGVSYTHGYWDSYYAVTLAAGDYTASITQYSNFAAGTQLSNGFVHDNDPAFTHTLGYGSQPYFNGVWGGNDYRTGDWAFHILNVEAASQQNPVPEPSTILLMGIGLLGLLGYSRKRSGKS